MNAASIHERDTFARRIADLRDAQPLVVAMGDIDGFSQTNAQFGHKAGDEVLALVQRTMSGSLPSGSLLSRVGGDEFACAFPSTTPEEALIILEEIRQHLARAHAITDTEIEVPMRFGIAAYPTHVNDPSLLLNAADEALERAKREGGSRVSIYVEDRMVLKSNYYPKAQLARLSKLADRVGRTEASLLREAAADLLVKYRDV